MRNPVVNLQKTPASKISSSVRMRNSGFSFNCRGQSTLSFYLSTLACFTRNERYVI